MVTYEWDCETVVAIEDEHNEEGEILDHAHGASFAEVHAWAESVVPPAGAYFKLVLVRDDDECRSWAYVENGMLDEFFYDTDGRKMARVPVRFVAEVKRALGTKGERIMNYTVSFLRNNRERITIKRVASWSDETSPVDPYTLRIIRGEDGEIMAGPMVSEISEWVAIPEGYTSL